MDATAVLQRYLAEERRGLLSRLDGLSERDVRWPGTGSRADVVALHHAAVACADATIAALAPTPPGSSPGGRRRGGP